MYSKKLKTIVQLSIVVCLIAFASCKKLELRFFQITVDSMSFPDTAFCAPDSVAFHVYGYIGPNNCYQFFDINFYLLENNDVVIEAVGEKTKNKGCGGGDSLLDRTFYCIFETPGVYTFYDINKTNIELGKIVVLP